MIEIKNNDIILNLNFDTKLTTLFNKNLNNITFRVYTNNNIIFRQHLGDVISGLSWWFWPNDSSYLDIKTNPYCEILLDDEIIYRKNIDFTTLLNRPSNNFENLNNIIEIENDDIILNLGLDLKLTTLFNKNLNNITLRVYTNNNIIFEKHLGDVTSGLSWWFTPNDRSYLDVKAMPYCEILLGDEIIYRKYIDFTTFFDKKKKNIIVQLGANRGNDDLISMVKNDDFLLLVEPFDKFNMALKNSYNKVDDLHIENLLIVDNNKEEEIIYSHRNMSGVLANEQIFINCEEPSSVLKSHVLKHYPDESGLIEYKIKCSTLNNLFEKYNLTNIDILFIDIEGLDDVVIKSINFDKYNIHKIYYENLHVDNEKIEKFLIDKNYNIKNYVLSHATSTLAIKNDFKTYKNYVQIGSNVGDDSFQRIMENITDKSNIFLIEPNSDLIEQLSYNYINLKNQHNIIIINSGISLTDEYIDLYLYDDSSHSSIINKRSHPNKSSKKIKCVNFNHFCDKYHIKNIELLSIDTEGMDYEILNSIDLSKIKIQNILFEKWAFEKDDLNNKYRTGENFLNTYIIPKYKNYKWDIINFDGAETYKLIKKDGVFFKNVSVSGYLGNQLFEIAATISLARDNGACAIFPEWKYSTYFDNNISDGNIENFEIEYYYDDFENHQYKKIPYTPNMDLYGYFQSEKYFKQHEKEIRNLFTLKSEYENNLRNKWAHLLNTKTVSIHVRRGDYLDHPHIFVVPTMSYFKKSLKYIEYLDSFNKIENVLIFSNDINWCRNNFNDNDYKYNFIENQSEIEDLFLMSYCDHNIISNSSFSWWGSWLNKNENKIICVPYKWFNNEWNIGYNDKITENMKIIKY